MWIENNTDKKECFRMDMVAVLIPCYNEAKTIEKVVKDYLKVLPENSKYMFMTIILQMEQEKLQKKREQSSEKNISRGRVMLSGECFARLMQSVILW